MPLSDIQIAVLRLLAAHRDPQSYVAGSTPLNRMEEWRSLASSEPLDPKDLMRRLRKALDDAEAFVCRMPTDKLGVLFLENGVPVQPDPEHLDDYQPHAGQRQGHWPSSPEIGAAMLELYRGPHEPEPDNSR